MVAWAKQGQNYLIRRNIQILSSSPSGTWGIYPLKYALVPLQKKDTATRKHILSKILEIFYWLNNCTKTTGTSSFVFPLFASHCWSMCCPKTIVNAKKLLLRFQRKLTWHLKRASWVRAGRWMRVGTTAASRRIWIATVWWMGEWVTVGLLERVWKSSIMWHMRLILSQVAKLSQETVLRVVFTVSRNKHRRKNWKGKRKGSLKTNTVNNDSCTIISVAVNEEVIL